MYKKIEELVKKSGKPASVIAKELGMPHSLFTGWKSGKYNPGVKNLKKIASYFNVSFDSLFADEQKDGKNSVTIMFKRGDANNQRVIVAREREDTGAVSPLINRGEKK